MYDSTRLIPQTQFDQLMALLPDPRNKKTERKRCNKEHLLSGILQVMILGIPWYQIFDCGCSFMSCYRYFKELQRRGLFKKQFLELSKVKTNVVECASDTNTIKSYRFKACVGYDGKHKVHGTKISLLTDINGLPFDAIIEKATIHDGTFCDQHIKNTRGRRKKMLHLDKAYTSAKRRRECRQKGIKINMEIKKGDYTRKRGPKFSFDSEKYKVRFKIERTFGWIENFRRVKYRVDRHISSYRAFAFLALIIILVRI